MRIFHNTKIDFLGKKYFGFAISLIIITICVGNFVINGFNLGIDFVGGHLIHVKYNELPSTESIRTKLNEAGFGTSVLQVDQGNKEVMIRVQREEVGVDAESVDISDANQATSRRVLVALRTSEESELFAAGKLDLNLAGKAQLADMLVNHDPLNYKEADSQQMTAEAYARREYMKVAGQLVDDYRDHQAFGIISNVDEALGAVITSHNQEEFNRVIKENTYLGAFSLLRAEMVSAAVGSELGEAAFWSVIYSLGGILIYIWLRFNNRFSVAAIVALVHDVIITMGIFTLAGREYNLPIVAAILTIVGYSLNDTIVIFVRIRENLAIKRREAKENYEGVLNMSINTTLSRTLLTSVTTLIVVLFLFFMGGSVINDFAFTLMVGVLVGTYSSIFVASPVLSIWQKITGSSGKVAGTAKTAKVNV